MSDTTLTSDGDGRWSIHGDLVFATVPGLLNQTGRLFNGQGSLVLDLDGVNRADSAGLALMLEWLGEGRKLGRQLSFRHVPQSLLNIARVSNVDELLPLVTE